MRTSLPGRVRRGLATFLTGTLVAGLAVGGVVAPAQAAPADVQGGAASWNFVDSWSGYVTGPIAQGTITPAPVDGASLYGPATGTYDDGTGTGTVRFGGSTRYEGHHGLLDVTVSALTLELTGPTSGTLRADFSGTVNEGAGDDVTVAALDVAVTRSGDEVTVVANGAIDSLTHVSSFFAQYDGRPISTLTARLTVPEPAAPAVATTTTLATDPAGTSVEGDAVALRATVAPAAAGTVEFRDGQTALGSAPVTDGVARLDATGLAVGDHSLTAAFTPADPTAFVGSTSPAVAHAVTAVEHEPEPEPGPEPGVDPAVTVSPSAPVDPAAENTFTISGTGFTGPGAANGAYVLLGEKTIWAGEGPLVADGWLALGWVMPHQVVSGAFTTTLTVPAGALDPAKEYVVATSAAHALSATDRTLDTFTPVSVRGAEPQEPVWEPSVTLYAADGVTPLGDDVVRAGDEIVVKGAGFDPEGNVGGRGVPIPATLPQGTYVVFGKFAEQWRPSEGVTSAARTVLSQQWALAEPVLDQVPPMFQQTIRDQWAEITPDGTFEARLTVGTSDGEGRYGVYTYGAGGVTNADQELYAPVSLTTDPPEPVWEPAIEVFAADGTTPLGSTEVSVGDTIVVKGTGFDPAGNVGGRGIPIPSDLPQGTYVVFGSFAEQWRPSDGAASSARKVGSQVWALAEPVLEQVPAQFQGAIRAAWVDIAEDGSFEAELVVKNPAALEGGRYGVYTYPAGGVKNADQELYAPVAFEEPAALTVTPAAATVEAGTSATLAVAGLVDGDSVKGVTLGGEKATFTRDGATLVLSVPAGAPAGDLPVVVTSELGVSGGTTLTVKAPPVVEPEPEPQPVTPTTVGTLTWGVKESFRRYITGPVAKGGATASDGASVDGGVFTFRQQSGWKAPAAGVATAYRGTVRFTGHDGLLDLALSNPVVDITGPGSARLVVDATSKGLDGSTFDRDDVAFATLALGTPTTHADGSVTYTGAAATLTADGAAAFSGFYPAGTPLDTVTFTVGAAAQQPGGGDGGEIGDPGGGSGGDVDPARATLSVAQVVPGGEVTISGVGFGANEAGLRTEIHSEPRVLATGVTANAGGAASSTVTIPTDLEPGEHTLLLIGAHHTASAPITVVGAEQTAAGRGAGADAAAEQCLAQGVNGATLTWGVSDRFRAYVTGPIAKGDVSTTGVRDNGTTFTWSGGKGSFNTDLGKGRASHGGTVAFSGHDGILDLRVSNPRVVVNGSTGTLVVDVQSSDMEGDRSTSKGIAFASLNLSGAKSTSGSTITWSGAPATLTAAGAAAFAGFYEAGTPLAPVTFSFPVGGDVECDVYSGLASTGSDDADLALLATTLVLAGFVLVGAAARRRARVLVTA
ncbi:HtaA domain-containing protein [Cellulosimicrobium cellulans]|uniref:HtaA domain-containing protein n=1 Tax=Cellulosimicrobium cellulans TaxID=1710 RepID=UPI00084897A8|nr:HtaA domain-containing protein [Cellulosimicrobium cellulans]